MTEAPADDLLAHGDPDPYAARDADSFRRALHQLLTRHRVFQQDVVAKAHRFGAQGVTEATASQLYTLGDTLPERKLIEVATGLCGLTPAEQDLWLDAWDRIEYGPVRYALYKSGPDRQQYRLPPVMNTEPSEEQGHWRTLAAYLYAAFGAPPVAGYSAARVEDVLAERVPVDARFLNAMLLACERSGAQPSAPAGAGAGRMLSDEVKRIIPADWDNTTPPASAGMLVRAAVNAIEDPEAAHFDVDLVDFLTSNSEIPASATRVLIERLAARLDTVDADPGPPRPTPPDPNAAVNAADFVRLMGELRTWSGMSLRALSDAAKEQGDWNLAASSLSDALRSDTLPRPKLLWALTGAAGLTTAQREQWAAARNRLERDAPASPRAEQAEPGTDVSEDDGESAVDVAEEVLPQPPAADLPAAELAAQAAAPAGSMYDALMTARQRLLHQCGYQGVCAEGVSEVQAATFTERDAQRDGRVWLPGVASAFGREQLAREVLEHLQRERGRRRRWLRAQLVALVGTETVELMESRLWVPAAEFIAEKERSRREVIEYKVDRMTAVAPPDKRYEYVARYGLLGIASLSPNDVRRHPADIQAVIGVLDSMAAAVGPDRPWWKRLRG